MHPGGVHPGGCASRGVYIKGQDGGLRQGVCIRESAYRRQSPRPARTRKAGGTHPTGLLSCICISPLQANKISRF